MTMNMTKKWIMATMVIILVAAGTLSLADSSWLTGTTEEKFDTLANIQPGLGTVMIEYGDRMGNMFHAAQVGNWGMAAYQLKEAVEIQEVGETTRPAKAPLLVNFEQTHLTRVAQDIVNKDYVAFQTDFNNMVNSCNACHAGTNHRYIIYRVPDQPSVPAMLDTGQTFTSEELQQILGDLVGE